MAIGYVEEENADKLGENDGVGYIRAQQPKKHDAIVSEGQRRASQAHKHHSDADHPLELPLGCLWRIKGEL